MKAPKPAPEVRVCFYDPPDFDEPKANIFVRLHESSPGHAVISLLHRYEDFEPRVGMKVLGRIGHFEIESIKDGKVVCRG